MPKINTEKLEEYAAAVYDRLEFFNDYTLKTIAQRIKSIGQLSAYDQQAIKNMADISGDMQKITKKLAQITEMNIEDLEKIYTDVTTDGVNSYKPLYDFKNIPFVPFEENEFAQALVSNWVRETAGTMVNLSRTKAIGFDKYDGLGNVIGHIPLEGAFEQTISGAVAAVSSGTVDFNSAMKKTIEELGGSGVKVTYGSGVNRSLSAMVRQNILYGAKQSAQAYDEYIGKQLGCDGFEVDAHSGCRPSHMFMQGKMYSYYGKKTVNGITYDDGSDALKALGDYGCLHFKTDVILGVSVPRYSSKELDRIKRETTELIEYDGREKTLYEWKQTQRKFERTVRNKQTQADMFRESGNIARARDIENEISVFRSKYTDMCKNIKGLEPHLDRMRTYKNIDFFGKSGIIKSGGVSGARNPFGKKAQEHATKYYESVRAMKTDVAHIAKTTGFSEEEIQEVKNFIFYDKHNLGGEVLERFAPDYMMGESWQRLINGTPEKHDIILIRHEIMEKQLMSEGYSQEEAHILTSKKYNYGKEAKKFYDKIKKYRD